MLELRMIVEPGMPVPEYATPGAACFDIVSADYGWMQPGVTRVYSTGLRVEVPPGFVMRVYSRSGLAVKHGVCLANGVGVIDSDYRGEIMVALINHGPRAYEVKRGERIAQAELAVMCPIKPVLVEQLSATERGEGGFGSTGR